ncbi:MAG: EsaB/YukD family protein, partial [Acidimicrobiia bacterium]
MEMCRLRLVCDRRRADVALPTELPVVDLLPDLVDLVAPEPNGDGGHRSWQLVHPVRGPLPGDLSLADVGVEHGTTLVLDVVGAGDAPVIVED